MDNGSELIEALKQIELEKGIDKEIIFEAIESSLVTACKKHYGNTQNVKVIINRETGRVDVYAQKTVVEEVKDAAAEITLETARKININHQMGDIVDIVVTPKDFGRISAQTAKQVVVQKFREAEREIQYKENKRYEKDIVTGTVQRKDKKNIIITLGRNTEAALPPSEQMPREEYYFNEKISVLVIDVKQTTKGPQVLVSRTHPDLVKRLFEKQVPEIHSGIVEIKSIAREAGSRTKIAVWSGSEDVDPVGACVGQLGDRVNHVVKELKGEKIDIIGFSPEPQYFIAAALSPSNVLAVAIDEEEHSARVVVPDYQLSLAIGKEGQNARLAARLTGWKIDIRSESQCKDTDFVGEEDYFEDEYDEDYDEEYYDDEEFEEGGESAALEPQAEEVTM